MTIQNVGDYETGLEDFDMSDVTIPRITIVHKSCEFKDSLSGETFPHLRTIMLGLVKQRVLWHTTVDDGDRPMCRSTNHSLGFPNLSDEQPREKRFPWSASNFSPEDYPPDDDGNIALPCSGCQLKEWKSHPDGKRPYCSEQYTMPILFNATEGDDDDPASWMPAIITFQKTGLKPLKTYLSSFARSKQPAFTAITQINLEARQRGQTDYAVPDFRKVGSTDEENWREYSVGYRQIRDFLEAAPGSREESEDEGIVVPKDSDNTRKPPAKKAAAAPPKEEPVEAEVVEEKPEPKVEPAETPAPTEAPAAAAAEDDDDLPF